VPSEFDIVDVRAPAVLEDENQLVLGAVQRAHPAVVLVPYAEVLGLGVDRPAGGGQLEQMTPVHADVMNRSI
jgi:hypothetical protein